MIITEQEIESLKAQSKPYKVSIGNSLYLLVMPQESKYWRLKYRYNGKSKTLSIGVFPIVSLDEALVEREKAKTLLKNGLDPSQEKQKALRNRITLNINTNFQMNMTLEGNLIIKNKNQSIKLNNQQTQALKHFLLAASASEEEKNAN